MEQFQEEIDRDAPHPLQGNENDDQQDSLNNGEDDAIVNEEDGKEETADDTETRPGNIEWENELNDELDDAGDKTPNDENDDKAFVRGRRWLWSRSRRRRTQVANTMCEV